MHVLLIFLQDWFKLARTKKVTLSIWYFDFTFQTEITRFTFVLISLVVYTA